MCVCVCVSVFHWDAWREEEARRRKIFARERASEGGKTSDEGEFIRRLAFAEQRSHYIFSKRREELNQRGSRAESARTPSVLRPVLLPRARESPFCCFFIVRRASETLRGDSLFNLITATFNWIRDRGESQLPVPSGSGSDCRSPMSISHLARGIIRISTAVFWDVPVIARGIRKQRLSLRVLYYRFVNK